jgi:hypothetical protein
VPGEGKAGVLVEEVLELERLDDPGRVEDPLAIEVEDREVPSPRENAIALDPPGSKE